MQRRKIIKLVATGSLLVAGVGVAALLQPNSGKYRRTAVNSQFPDIADGAELPVTPACGKQPTLAQTEGPYFTPNTPKRTSLREADIVGIPLVLEGHVMDKKCHPIAGALLDFWSCDGNGIYDNQGFKLRGHQFTDANGAYRLETIRPANYRAGFMQRTAHIHVKVQGKQNSLLTTQLYFPDDPINATDGIFNPALLMDLDTTKEQQWARFDFVLA